MHDELGGGEHRGEEGENSEGGVDHHESGPDGGIWGEAAFDVDVGGGEIVFEGFDVEPGGPEVAVFDGDDEHEVVACGSAFDGVVFVVHYRREETQGLILVDGEIETKFWSHGGDLHGLDSVVLG